MKEILIKGEPSEMLSIIEIINGVGLKARAVNQNETQSVAPALSLGKDKLTFTFLDINEKIKKENLTKWLVQQVANEKETQHHNNLRWNSRASNWQGIIADTKSYVNFENEYERFNNILAALAKKAETALEIGCGTGDATKAALTANQHLKVRAIDPAREMIKIAQQNGDADYAVGDVFSETGNYDLVYSRGVVVSHIPKLCVWDYIKKTVELTDNNGIILLDFMQNLYGNDVEKPVGDKNLLDINWVSGAFSELNCTNILADGNNESRIRIVAYRKESL
jgi:SAM-dependent methyltransferase